MPVESCRAPAAAHRVLGDVGPQVQAAQLIHEVGGVISLVGAEHRCDGAVGAGFECGQRGQALGMAVGLRQAGIREQAGAALHHRDGAGPLLAASRRPFPFIEKVFADAGY